MAEVNPAGSPVVITATSEKAPPKGRKLIILIAVILILLVGIGAGVYFILKPSLPFGSKASGAKATLLFKPEKVQTAEGQEFNTDVVLNSPDFAVSTVELHLQYNPEELTLESINNGSHLSEILQQPVITQGTGSVTLGNLKSEPKKGTGTLATLKFKALKASNSKINIDIQKTKIAAEGVETNALGDASSSEVSISPSAPILPTIEGTPSAIENNPAQALPISLPPLEGLPTTATGSAAPATPSGEELYDFNGDGKVNSLDLSVLYSGWGIPKNEMEKKADLNGDGSINSRDYSLFSPHLKK